MFSRVNAMLIFSTVIWAMISCLTACFAQPEENFPDPPSAGRPLTPAPAGRWQTYTVADGLPYPSIAAVAADKQGGVWVGTPQGAAHFSNDRWSYFREKQGLISNLVMAVAVDQRGTAWFGTDKGISRYDGETWTSFDAEDGLQNGFVLTLMPDHSGGIWIAVTGAGGDWAFGNGVARLVDRGTAAKSDDLWWFFPPTRQRMAGGMVSAVVDARVDGVWFSLTPEGTVRQNESQGGLWQMVGYATQQTSDDHWRPAIESGRRFHTTITAMVQTSERQMWLGTPNGLMAISISDEGNGEIEVVQTVTTADGLPSDRILALAAGPGHILWIGTENGLALWQGETIAVYTTADGLPSNQIRDIAIDTNGFIWIATPSGVSILRHS